MRKILSLSILLIFTVLLTESCDDKETADVFKATKSENSGNLLIVNNSNSQLVLYKNAEILAYIPNSSSDFRLHIPNPSEGNVELTLFKWEDVKDDKNNPNSMNIFKKWKIALSDSKSVENSVTWHVTDNSESSSATVSFNYYGGTENSVDVYLNGHSGAKIMSLKPGDQYKQVGLDYETHTLHYRYWFSDPNTSGGEDEIGWRETQTIMGKEKPIFLVLKDGRDDETIIIPHYSATQAIKFGNIRISNESGDLVQVYVGNQLIEQVCYLETGNVQNLSSMTHNDAYTFTMPITIEDAEAMEYKFIAKNSLSGNIVEEYTTSIIADETINWKIDGIED